MTNSKQESPHHCIPHDERLPRTSVPQFYGNKRGVTIRCNHALVSQGMHLSQADIETLLLQRNELLASFRRMELGCGVLPLLVETFAASSFLEADNLIEQLEGIQEGFYSLRDDLPVDITDEEIAQAMLIAFEDKCGGDASMLCTLDYRDITDEIEGTSRGTVPEAYSIADDEGRIYRFDPNDWIDDFTSNGWDGEKWTDDI